MNLRNTSLTDVNALQDLERAAAQRFLAIPELVTVAHSEVTASQTHVESIAQNLAWLIEDEQGTILGFCYAQLLSDSLYLAEISSHPSAQGKGVGRLLVDHVRKAADEHQRKGVTLTTFLDVPWNAAWYRKQGFITLEASTLSPELREIMQLQQDAGFMLLPRCVMWAPALKSG